MKIIFLFILQIIYSSQDSFQGKKLDEKQCTCKITNQLLDTPFQVTIGILKKNLNIDVLDQVCSGIIINDIWILAPASCVEKDYLKDKKIIVSSKSNDDLYEHFFTSYKNNLYSVKNIYRHNLYVKNKNYLDHYLYNFAFISLTESLKGIIDQSLQPACFYNSQNVKQFYGMTKIMYGWGVRKPLFTNDKGDLLNEEENHNRSMTKINFNNKVKYFTKFHQKRLQSFCLRSDLLCLGSENPACLGDIGSPLYLVEDDYYYVIGLANSAPPFKYYENKHTICMPGSPSFFTRMELIIEMMDSLLGEGYFCQVNLTGIYDLKPEPKAIVKNDESNDYCNCNCSGMFKDTFESLSFDEDFKGTKIANGYFSFNRMVPIYYYTNKDDKSLSEFVCLATVLNPYFIISTANCVSRGKNTNYFLIKDKNLFNTSTNEEKISATIDIEEFLFHPNYFNYKDILSFNIVIMKLQKPLDFSEDSKNKLSPVCLPDVNVFSNSKSNFYILPSENYYEIDDPITVIRKQPNSFFISDDNCTISICLKHNHDKKIQTDGYPLFQFNKNHIEFVGVFTKKFSEKKTSSYFISILKINNWVKSVIGDFAYCEKKEAKNSLDKQFCSCENSFKDTETTVPFVVTLIHYKLNEPLNIPKVFCKGVLMNEYWFLTTSKCLMKPGRKVSDVYISLVKNTELAIKQFDLFLSLDLIKKVSYAINHPGYLKDPIYNDVALAKLEKGVILDENSKQQLACFGDLLIHKSYEDSHLIIDEHNPEIFFKNSDQNGSKSLLINCNNRKIMCLEINDYFCETDEGNAIILIKKGYSVVIGLILSRFKNDLELKCTQSENILALKISSKITWINSIIGRDSYCKSDLKMESNLCKCKDNNHTTIAYHFGGNMYKLLCKSFIINTFYILTTKSCLIDQGYTSNAEKFFVISAKNVKVSNLDDNSFYMNDNKKVHSIDSVSYKPFSQNRFEDSRQKIRYDVALIRLKKKLELGDSTLLYPSCLGKINKDLDISKVFSINKNDQSPLYFNQNDEFDKKCSYENILCVKSSSKFCKSDQGEPIGYESNGKIKRIGFLLNPFYGSESISKSKCFVPGYLEIFLISTSNKWLINQIDFEGYCTYDEEEFEEQQNFCKCDYENLIDISKLDGNEPITNKLFSFVAQVYTTNGTLLPKNACSFTLLGTGLLLNSFWVITSNFLGISNTNPDYILINLGSETITNECNYKGPIPKMHKIDYAIASKYSDGPLLMKLKSPIILGKKTGIYPACVAKLTYSDNQQIYSLGFGVDSGQKKKLDLMQIPYLISSYTNYIKGIQFSEESDSKCGEHQLCFKPKSRVRFLDMGGPLVRIHDNKIETVAILTPKIINSNFVEYSENDLAKLINLNYFKDWIISETREDNFCFI